MRNQASPSRRTTRLGGSKQWYLDHRLVAPGDVILQLGSSPFSKTITKVTRSRFSHAQLALGGLIVYEALADGIFPTTLSFESVLHDGSQRQAVALPGVRRAVVLRHRSLLARVESRRFDVQDELLEITGRFLGRPYADLVQLLGAAPQPGVRPLSEWLGRKMRAGTLSERDRGIFCSELVARAMGAMGLDLFTPQRQPGAISPGELAKSTFLQEVDGAAFEAERVAASEEERRLAQSWETHRIPRGQFVKTDRFIETARVRSAAPSRRRKSSGR